MWKILLSVCLLFLAGCSGDPSGQVTSDHGDGRIYDNRLPPQFHLGDKVTVENTPAIGIIVRLHATTYSPEGDEPKDTWMYDVMFQQQTIQYVEAHLKMLEPMKWSTEKGVYE